MLLKDLPVFFLDLQTTGAKPESAQILEIAWGTNKENIESYVVQLEGRYLPPRHIQELTGIGEREMETAIPTEEAIDKLICFLQTQAVQDGPAVIHFAQFEKPFLNAVFDKLGKEKKFSILCTHEIAKRLFPNLPARGIKGLAGYFGFPVENVKRSRHHVEATIEIWHGLQDRLSTVSVSTVEDLHRWLDQTQKTTRGRYEYPLAKEKRLMLPDLPGVYRMLNKNREILYVGKATSLRDRVNSYFRGQKKRDPRKLEMLTQVWDLDVTVCDSPLEAAVLETDEIKKYNPRYNISLKVGKRQIVFYTRDFMAHSNEQDFEYLIGPFPNGFVLDSIVKLAKSIQSGSMSPFLFFDPLEPELLENGFKIFCERHQFDPLRFANARNIIAQGLQWYREVLNTESLTKNDDEEPLAEIQAEDSEAEINFDGEEEILELTPEDIADRFERHFTRAGKSYLRARKLTRLLNSEIDFQIFSTTLKGHLTIRRGKISKESLETKEDLLPWQGLDIETYDRMTVLSSELEKIRLQAGEVHIRHI